MLRAACSLLRQGALARGISTSAARLEEAAPAGVKEFAEAFTKIAPSTMNLPQFPSSFLGAEAARDSAAEGEQFPVNFYTPDGVVAEGKVRAAAAACPCQSPRTPLLAKAIVEKQHMCDGTAAEASDVQELSLDRVAAVRRRVGKRTRRIVTAPPPFCTPLTHLSLPDRPSRPDIARSALRSTRWCCLAWRACLALRPTTCPSSRS
jgi:hypothetical protein